MSRAMPNCPPVRPVVRPKRTHLETATGRYLDYNDPKHTDVSLDDISLALSNTCRWGGQCPHFYSVAEHACLVHDLVGARAAHGNWIPELRDVLQLAALHHDDHEAYVGDIPTPLKNMLGPEYYELTGRLDRVIGRALKLGWGASYLHDPEVKRADNLALYLEAGRFKVSKGLTWEGRPDVVELPAGVEWVAGVSPAEARAAYLCRHFALSRP